MAPQSHPHAILLSALAAVVVTATVVWTKTRKQTTEEELEHARRDHLTAAGRVIDGTLLGIDSPEGERAQHEDGARVLYYCYEISGVVYESSQDVKQLQRHVRPENCRLASAISVRYDPRDHTNSMIVAESWSGLRKAPATSRLVLQRPLET